MNTVEISLGSLGSGEWYSRHHPSTCGGGGLGAYSAAVFLREKSRAVSDVKIEAVRNWRRFIIVCLWLAN